MNELTDEHLRHVADDPLVTRFCGLARLPTGRTVANWLKLIHPGDARPARGPQPATGDRDADPSPTAPPDHRRGRLRHPHGHEGSAFACGRGAPEKTFAELKDEFALDVVPTNDYAANSAWQQLSVLAHNLARSFQLDTGAPPKPRSRKRTYAFLFPSMRTLRFLIVARAARVTRIDDRNVLRLAHNPATQAWYERIAHALAA